MASQYKGVALQYVLYFNIHTARNLYLDLVLSHLRNNNGILETMIMIDNLGTALVFWPAANFYLDFWISEDPYSSLIIPESF